MSVNSKFINEADMPSDIRPVGYYGDHQIPRNYVYSSSAEHFYLFNEKLHQYRVLREEIIGRQKGDTKAVTVKDVNGKSTYILLDRYLQQFEQPKPVKTNQHERSTITQPVDNCSVDDWLRDVVVNLFTRECVYKSVPYRFALVGEVHRSLRDYKRKHPGFVSEEVAKEHLRENGFEQTRMTVIYNLEKHERANVYRIPEHQFVELMRYY